MNRSTSWLKTAAAGMLALAACLGLTASAQSNALYLDNGAIYNTGLTALTNLHFNVTTITSANSLTNQLATGTWDVVVIEQYNSVISTNPALALQDYAANGGAVVLSYWDMDGANDFDQTSRTSAPILRATFGVQATVSFDDPQGVFVWQPTNAIFTTPYAISGLATNGNLSWTDNGDRMEAGPASFAQALAGFTNNNTYEQAAIIEANNGRTICNGFLFDNMDWTNGLNLLQNEITYAIRPTLPTVAPSMGEFSDRIRVSWNSTAATQYELFRSTNAANGFVSLGVLAGTVSNYDDTAATLPGTYYYYSVSASNAFGTRGNSVAQPGWRRSVENHAVADYDGDGRADPAIYNETTGEWAVRFSGNDAYTLFKITLTGMDNPGFIAVSADYDGDRMPDPGVYNASTGEWRILLSGSAYYLFISTLNNLGGLYFYSALGADYDGDRFADPIVYQETDGSWRFMLSSYDYMQYETGFGNLGGMGWSMTWADYDGDGYADPIVYQETSGTWKVLQSGSGYALMTTTFDNLGGLGFIPVLADYDGDGAIDPAVCNLATGEWRVIMSGVRVTAHLTF